MSAAMWRFYSVNAFLTSISYIRNCNFIYLLFNRFWSHHLNFRWLFLLLRRTTLLLISFMALETQSKETKSKFNHANRTWKLLHLRIIRICFMHWMTIFNSSTRYLYFAKLNKISILKSKIINVKTFHLILIIYLFITAISK